MLYGPLGGPHRDEQLWVPCHRTYTFVQYLCTIPKPSREGGVNGPNVSLLDPLEISQEERCQIDPGSS